MFRSEHRHEARVLPLFAAEYPGLNPLRWYNIRPGKVEEEGACWLIGYGFKKRVKCGHFEIREVARQRLTH